MSQAEHVIGKFGGIRKMAAALGHKNPSTVQGWKERGFIPPRRYDEVIAAAARESIDLCPADFVIPPPAADPPEAAA